MYLKANTYLNFMSTHTHTQQCTSVYVGTAVHICVCGYSSAHLCMWVQQCTSVYVGTAVHICVCGYSSAHLCMWVQQCTSVYVGTAVHICVCGYSSAHLCMWVGGYSKPCKALIQVIRTTECNYIWQKLLHNISRQSHT